MPIMRVYRSGDYVLVYDSDEVGSDVPGKIQLSQHNHAVVFQEEGKPGLSRLLHGVGSLHLDFGPMDAGAIWVHHSATDEQAARELEAERQRNRERFEALSARLAPVAHPLTVN